MDIKKFRSYLLDQGVNLSEEEIRDNLKVLKEEYDVDFDYGIQ